MLEEYGKSRLSTVHTTVGMALICWSPGGYVLAPEKREGVGKVQSATYGSYTSSRENDRTENTHIDTTEVNERLG